MNREDWNDLFEFVRPVFIIVCSVMAAVFLIAFLCAVTFGPLMCRETWHDSGMEYRWDFLPGCMVKSGKNWVPEGVIKVLR